MKAVRFVFKLVIVLVVLAVAAVAALPVWFGPVAKTVANSAVPGIVKTDFRLEHLSLNPYTARFELGGLNLGNPRGYREKDAVRVGEIIVDAETPSLLTEVIHIEEIAVRDLFVSVVSGGENKVLNFRQLQYDVAGGKEKYDAAQSEKEARAAAEADNPEQKADKPSKKIIIDRLEVSGLTLKLSILPLRIPTVVLKDIGRKDGGATLEEAWRQIFDGIMKAAGVTGDQLRAFGILSGDAVKKAGEAVSKTTERATKAVDDATKQLSATTETATKAVDDATKQLTSGSEKAAAAVGGITKRLSTGTGKATESVSATAGAATDMASGAVKGGTKAVDEGVKAVGDGAKKAMESLKSLW